MSNDLMVQEDSNDVVISRAPEIVLEEAHRAAKALATVLSGKKKPFMMNGEQYLEFEDWQTVGRFYGITAKVTSSSYIAFEDKAGWEAHAIAINVKTGMEISSADAMCLNNEKNWVNKPDFQLRSMAQTRACSKALRNVLAWVVVLAGFKATPAEEMEGVSHAKEKEVKRSSNMDVPDNPSSQETAQEVSNGKLYISEVKVIPFIDKKSGKNKERFEITASNGVIYKTFDKKAYESAEKALSAALEVVIAAHEGKFGWELDAMNVMEPGDITSNLPITPQEVNKVLRGCRTLVHLENEWLNLQQHIGTFQGPDRYLCQLAHDETATALKKDEETPF